MHFKLTRSMPRVCRVFPDHLITVPLQHCCGPGDRRSDRQVGDKNICRSFGAPPLPGFPILFFFFFLT